MISRKPKVLQFLFLRDFFYQEVYTSLLIMKSTLNNGLTSWAHYKTYLKLAGDPKIIRLPRITVQYDLDLLELYNMSTCENRNAKLFINNKDLFYEFLTMLMREYYYVIKDKSYEQSCEYISANLLTHASKPSAE